MRFFPLKRKRNVPSLCLEHGDVVLSKWRSEQESNPHWQYRKLQSYPLNDRSIEQETLYLQPVWISTTGGYFFFTISSLSSMMVNGPWFSMETAISAPKTPVCTFGITALQDSMMYS